MADPLSIAASVAGLIALSGSIYKIVGDFVERAAHPPQSAHALLLSVSEMRMVLKSVSDLIDDFLKYPPKRRALVRLDHLIICLTQAVLSFSELEKFVNPWATRTQRSLWQRWKLASQDERISRFNTRLQENKLSISLVLNILQCESDTDAQQYQLSLHGMMERVINENRELRTRVDHLGSFLMGSAPSIITSVPSIATTFGRPESPSSMKSTTRVIRLDDDGASTISESKTILYPPDPYSASLPIPVSSALGLPASLYEPSFLMPFEHELAQSWVYARVKRTECDISFTTQQVSGLWSMLSGLSLGQISNISVIALPITLNDVSNSIWYKESTRPNLALIEPHQLDAAKDSAYKDKFHNIAVLGECEVGKSTLLTTLCYGDPEQTEKYSTLGLDYYTSICVYGKERQLRITDTPGLGASDYAIMVDEAIRYAEGFVLIYSVTDRDSFQRIQTLYDTIIRIKQLPPDQRPPVVIVANKVDLEESNVVPPESAFSLAEELDCALFECSVKHDVTIASPFIALVKFMLNETP
ncbi:P-loop containing nucleoside triphosphate hydrolase protein [Xylaria bambusicola]|uniref:P-loop containing nucleoside triphosphate hydrolase protein n=1 Tax=Xylaria bambusicola TaxID=326684 RepID=UPI00200729AD|nr:P-loop containing nucleoside triphosphate hydrolase protein [Xylaria bambusicola]KAI0509384.1 P-loop containing nucleoside triphosphate hydrolase protein [Xylaria bambusicola]